MLDSESLDSGKSTPRFLESPSMDFVAGKSSPLVVTQYRSKPEDHVFRSGRGSPDSSSDQTTESDSRQPLSPLAKSSHSSGRSSTEHSVSDSQPKGLSIYPNSSYEPAEDSDEEHIVSYTLSSESASTSKDSESSLANEPSSTEHTLHSEGTD